MSSNYDDEDDDDYEEKQTYGPPKQNQQAANKDVRNVVKDLHLEPDEKDELHDLLREDYLGYQEILARAKSRFNPYRIEYKNGEKPRWQPITHDATKTNAFCNLQSIVNILKEERLNELPKNGIISS